MEFNRRNPQQAFKSGPRRYMALLLVATLFCFQPSGPATMAAKHKTRPAIICSVLCSFVFTGNYYNCPKVFCFLACVAVMTYVDRHCVSTAKYHTYPICHPLLVFKSRQTINHRSSNYCSSQLSRYIYCKSSNIKYYCCLPQNFIRFN